MGTQLIARGVIKYAPLVGVPSALSVHAEETAFIRRSHHAFNASVTTEHAGMFARRSAGGAQLPSVVEGIVAAVARDLVNLLYGVTTASKAARDTLRQFMFLDPTTAERSAGLVQNAMRFLSGDRVFLSVSTDRTVSRLLDAKQQRDGWPPQRQKWRPI